MKESEDIFKDKDKNSAANCVFKKLSKKSAFCLLSHKCCHINRNTHMFRFSVRKKISNNLFHVRDNSKQSKVNLSVEFEREIIINIYKIANYNLKKQYKENINFIEILEDLTTQLSY